MIKDQVSVEEFARNLKAYLDRVIGTGEPITIVRDGNPVAELSRVPIGVRVADLPAIFASLPHLTEEEAEAFAHDIEAGRNPCTG